MSEKRPDMRERAQILHNEGYRAKRAVHETMDIYIVSLPGGGRAVYWFVFASADRNVPPYIDQKEGPRNVNFREEHRIPTEVGALLENLARLGGT